MIKSSVILNIISSIIYTTVFLLVYRYFLFAKFAYFGYELNNLTFTNALLTIVISIIPSAFHFRVKNITGFFAVMIYIIVYIPTIVVLVLSGLVIEQIKWTYIIVFFISMITFFLAERINPIPKIKITSIKKFRFSTVLLVTLALVLYVLLVYRNNFKIVSYENIYNLREANSAVAKGNALAGYLILWLTYCFLPLSLIFGLIQKRKIPVILAITGHIIIFGCTASKASFFMPVIIFSFYLLFKKFTIEKTLFNLNISLSIISVIILLLSPIRIFFLISSLLFMRTTALAGLLNVQYLNFFEENKHTFYSHINFVNKLTKSYPYGNEPLGKVVGYDFYQSGINANANFWATDGIASIGPAGIFIITLIVILFLNLVNRLIPEKSMFVYLSFVPSSFALLNVSFFTALNSCGIIFLIIILMNVKINSNKVPEQNK